VLDEPKFNEELNKMPLDELNLLDDESIICRIKKAKLNELNPAVLKKLVSCPEKLSELNPDAYLHLRHCKFAKCIIPFAPCEN